MVEVLVARADVGVCEVVVGITMRYLVYILHSGFLIAREEMWGHGGMNGKFEICCRRFLYKSWKVIVFAGFSILLILTSDSSSKITTTIAHLAAVTIST